jgi:hypothetical protein
VTDLHETTRLSAGSSPAAVEFISVPEWCRRMGCSLDSGYRAVRRNQVPWPVPDRPAHPDQLAGVCGGDRCRSGRQLIPTTEVK